MTAPGAESFLLPLQWAPPAGVRALFTTRRGGCSAAPWDSFNLATHVGDDAAAVARNRALLRRQLSAEPCWLEQVHGAEVADAALVLPGTLPCADAVIARQPGQVCAVMTADCLPLLLCDREASVVAAVHAGWRGLAAGVIEATVARMGVAGEQLLAWLGPAIGPAHFEVGDEVRACFVAQAGAAGEAFLPADKAGKWQADLFLLARQRLQALGVSAIAGGGLCTASDSERFFSYRRDGQCGRMAALIWLEKKAAA